MKVFSLFWFGYFPEYSLKHKQLLTGTNGVNVGFIILLTVFQFCFQIIILLSFVVAWFAFEMAAQFGNM